MIRVGAICAHELNLWAQMEESVISLPGRRRNQRHELERKVSIVEETLVPGASVAKIARKHGINANQIFAWRKLYREGLLGNGIESLPTLLPVTVDEGHPCSATPEALKPSPPPGLIHVESAKGRLTIEGQPDPTTLRIVLGGLFG